MNRIAERINKEAKGLFHVFVVLFFLLSPLHAANHDTQVEPLPTTISGVWEAIDKHMKAMDEAVANNQLDKIHHHAFAVRDLVNALPALSQSLSSEKLAAVKRDSKYVDLLAVRLDKTGDTNDKEGTAANLQKLKKILTSIRGNYMAIHY